MEILTEAAARLEQRAQELPPSTPFKSYISRALSQTDRSKAEAFFRKKLYGIDYTTAPFEIVDSRIDASSIQEHRLKMDPATTQRIRMQASRYRVSPGRLFHAAWSMVVAHTSGRDDLVFGTVLLAAEQRARGANSGVMLGPCINSLPLRVSLRGISCAEFVLNVSREISELLAYDAVPLAAAQRCSGITNGSALFTTLFNFRRGDSQFRVDIADEIGIQVVSMTGTRTGYPITMSVNDFGEGFELIAQVEPRLSPQRINRYLETAISSLIQALDVAPDKAVLDLPIIPASERHLLLKVFNDTWADYPRCKPAHKLFEEWAARKPQAVAVTDEDNSMTYGETNRQANRLARLLTRLGAKVGDYVPVVMPRSTTMIVAQLAVLKCGCIYVPVDPEFPVERQAFIIRDCAARIVLAAVESQHSDATGVLWIDVVAMSGELSCIDDANLNLQLLPTAPAYVMYTSGSTGVPKGVVVPHHAIVRLVLNNGYADLNSNDHLIHYSNPAFDASTFEVWGALLNGARVVIVPQATVLDSKLFATVLRVERISVLWMTVGLFNQYADTLSSVLSSLRYVIVGGDSLDVNVIRRVLTTSRPKILLNAYGPTECTTFTTTHAIQGIENGAASIPIGKPIANAQVYVLDSQMRALPIGVAGEMYIGGDGVAAGYLNRAVLTAERFVADPFGCSPGQRLYRTGDVVRRGPDGTIDFLGRTDGQVKIRGFRVELGEVQARAEGYSGIKEAFVTTKLDKTGQRQIVCYFTVIDPRNSPTGDSLREHLRATLPHYMVPSSCVLLDKLPLNANGKIDRKALPAPDLIESAADVSEAPQTEIEVHLAEIWQQLLDIRRINRYDNLFELGAHSLHVLHGLMRIRERHDVPISVKDVYNSPTIFDLAKRLQGKSLDQQYVNLQCEAILPSVVTALPGTCSSPPREVLLTGGTGFVGRFLLRQLLENPELTVHCLLRCHSKEDGLSILKTKLITNDLWRDEFAQRIVVVPGNLRQSRLGIDDPTYAHLSRVIDVIYHCATSMNHLEPYAMAKLSNVGGSVEILKLAAQHKPILVNYMSTASVFSSPAEPGVRLVSEDSCIDHETHPASKGYAASKWVGEKLFMIARERGVACNIFRLGLIWADTALGRYDELQRGHRLLKSCILSGLGIKNYRFEMPPTPVDYAARAIVHLSNAYPNGQGLFHISSSRQMREGLFECINNASGGSLRILPFYDWICEIKHLHENGISLPAVPLVEYAFSMDERMFLAQQRHAQSHQIRFDATLTQATLERAGIVAPAFDDQLLMLCVERMLSEADTLRDM
jgi:amino acid adenylation domain-containing protein/thioester reductase-like protein